MKWALDTAMEKPEGEIFVIPARLEECEVLDSLSEWQWVDLFEPDGYERLIKALRARAESVGATLHGKKSRKPRTSPAPVKAESHVEKENIPGLPVWVQGLLSENPLTNL